jgi:ribose/xylose/arabinose/galactoside ABC-type transport system permease subunit
MVIKMAQASFKERFTSFMEKYAIYIALLLLCIVLSSVTDKFLTVPNLKLILNQISINGILAIGVTFPLITAGIDISIGSVVGLAGVVAALTAPANSNVSIFVPILAALAVGLAIGSFNGLLITKGKLAPYIVSLGMMTIVRGLSLIVSGGRPVSRLIPAFAVLGNNTLFSIPLPIFIFAAVAIITHIILTHLKIGRYIYAVGGNTNAAYASGISPEKIKFFVHVMCSTLAGLAGIILASRINTGHPNSGSGYELDAIAAAVVGGTSLAGGTGGIPGTVIGALIIGVLSNGLDLLAVSSYWQQVVKGLIIIASVLIDRNKKRQ